MKASIIIFFLTLHSLLGIAQKVKIELSKELSTKNIATIKLYKFNSKNDCNQSKAVSVIFENNIAPCFNFVKAIKKESVKKIIACLRTKKMYGGEDVACFDTDYSLIMYNAKGVIVGYINISLFCNKLMATPKIQEMEYFTSSSLRKVGFSTAGRKKLIKLLGLPSTKPYPSQTIN